MGSLLETLNNREVWEAFLQNKQQKGQLDGRERKELEDYISEERYRKVTESMAFGYPVRKEIAKTGSSRKRVVYSYSPDETWVLKLLAWELYRYDGCLPDNCYAFRRDRNARTAIADIRKIPELDRLFALKLDLHDYFNSIEPELLIDVLGTVITDDPPLLDFLSGLLRQHRCIRDGAVTEEDRGAMAGVPLASFFANVYLMDLDRLFLEKGIPYFRYSDDLILFFPDSAQLEENLARIRGILDNKRLTLNEEKFSVSGPGESWEYLGFVYCGGNVDLAPVTVQKMKDRIRRKAHALWRWRKRNEASFERAARAMIRSFDRKLYDLSGDHTFTWTRYYFPVLTCSDGLKEIDRYMVRYLRFLSTGRHCKANYRVTYGQLKQLGYTPLAAEYYNWKKENARLRDREDF